MKPRQIAVIGGGASGLAAALCAAREGCKVHLFEASDRVGKSILATGDGRCNIANTLTEAKAYHNPEFVRAAFETLSPQEALGFLEDECGIMMREESQGRLYPLANKATSVLDALRLRARHLKVEELCESPVSSVRFADGSWRVTQAGGKVRSFDAVILACGGGFVPEGLLPEGVHVLKSKPVLAPMKTSTEDLKGLDKVRAKCAVRLGPHVEEGEVTFRSYGLSGIAAFNLTRLAKRGDRLFLDFLPEEGLDDTVARLVSRIDSLAPVDWLELTCGMMLPLVARAILRKAGLNPTKKPVIEDLPALAWTIHAFELRFEGIGDAKLAQVHRGGIDTGQVDPTSMQIAGFPGLFCAGEMIDVDGPCGGYNLHWAWVSGMIAGRMAAHDQTC